ncbi:unnamed protein product [Gongylonema pulchrum]|uniref:SCP domain-containing protein n=1 Tax=Gongylonema pulchrum TaxID=637853 RepID=A0A183D4Q4_9BILA|nr:unnamed protein product [Gongylonema pulchrum]
MIWLALILAGIISRLEGCSPRYREELRYLDHYLGIQPANRGNLPTAENALNRYITNSSELNCQFKKECAWINAPDDDLLDTSDFYLFVKTDAKSFPVQIQPGPPDPPNGSSF